VPVPPFRVLLFKILLSQFKLENKFLDHYDSLTICDFSEKGEKKGRSKGEYGHKNKGKRLQKTHGITSRA